MDKGAVVNEPARSLDTIDDELRLAEEAAVTVLITADSRVDREICARAIHASSRSIGGPLVIVSATRLNDASAGTVSAHGFGDASGATLFVDDIVDLNAGGQAQLLALLDERATGLRIIAGASRHLTHERASGAFSEPLFYRLNIVHLDLTRVMKSSVD